MYSELLAELLNKLYIKSEFVPVQDMKAYWGVRSVTTVILKLGTRWEWVELLTASLNKLQIISMLMTVSGSTNNSYILILS